MFWKNAHETHLFHLQEPRKDGVPLRRQARCASSKRVPRAARRIRRATAGIRAGAPPERQLARRDINKVLANIGTQGYHLQMPPARTYIEHLPRNCAHERSHVKECPGRHDRGQRSCRRIGLF